MKRNVKKILTLVILSLMALNSAFGCDSPFKGIKGITCELQYDICKNYDVKIKVCDNIKEKVEQYEKEYSIAEKHYDDAVDAWSEVAHKKNQIWFFLDLINNIDDYIISLNLKDTQVLNNEYYKKAVDKLAYFMKEFKMTEEEYQRLQGEYDVLWEEQRQAWDTQQSIRKDFLGEKAYELQMSSPSNNFREEYYKVLEKLGYQWFTGISGYSGLYWECPGEGWTPGRVQK